MVRMEVGQKDGFKVAQGKPEHVGLLRRPRPNVDQDEHAIDDHGQARLNPSGIRIGRARAHHDHMHFPIVQKLVVKTIADGLRLTPNPDVDQIRSDQKQTDDQNNKNHAENGNLFLHNSLPSIDINYRDKNAPHPPRCPEDARIQISAWNPYVYLRQIICIRQLEVKRYS